MKIKMDILIKAVELSFSERYVREIKSRNTENKNTMEDIIKNGMLLTEERKELNKFLSNLEKEDLSMLRTIMYAGRNELFGGFKDVDGFYKKTSEEKFEFCFKVLEYGDEKSKEGCIASISSKKDLDTYLLEGMKLFNIIS